MKYTKTNVHLFCSLIADGNTEQTACAQLGITMDKFQHWLTRPRFAQAYAKAKSDIQILLTSKLLKHAARDPRSAQYLHERVHPDYRRNNARTVAEAKQDKFLTADEHAARLREIFGVKRDEVVSTESNGEEPCQDKDEVGMSISEAMAADKAARDYGAKAAREYERRELSDYIQPEPDPDGEKPVEVTPLPVPSAGRSV